MCTHTHISSNNGSSSSWICMLFSCTYIHTYIHAQPCQKAPRPYKPSYTSMHIHQYCLHTYINTTDTHATFLKLAHARTYIHIHSQPKARPGITHLATARASLDAPANSSATPRTHVAAAKNNHAVQGMLGTGMNGMIGTNGTAIRRAASSVLQN